MPQHGSDYIESKASEAGLHWKSFYVRYGAYAPEGSGAIQKDYSRKFGNYAELPNHAATMLTILNGEVYRGSNLVHVQYVEKSFPHKTTNTYRAKVLSNSSWRVENAKPDEIFDLIR